jgi:hypothetical protein
MYRGDFGRYVAGNFSKYGTVCTEGFIPREFKGLHKVDFVGAGFLLVKSHVFGKMTYPWFHEAIIHYKKNGQKRAQYAGDDIGFCLNAKKHNIPIWVDLDCVVTHLIETTQSQ